MENDSISPSVFAYPPMATLPNCGNIIGMDFAFD
jgi:hypothetical protein